MSSYIKITKLGKEQKGTLKYLACSYLWHKQWLSSLDSVQELLK